MITYKNALIFLALGNTFAHSVFPNDVFPDSVKSRLSLLQRQRSNDDHSENDESSEETNNYKVCRTEPCTTIAEEFLSSMNKSVDPCEDFYEFTCGAWTTNSPLPPSLPVWNRFMNFQQTVYYRIKEVLETEIEDSDILPVRQAKKWYRSCMDTETLDRRNVKPIESILIQAGGWPMSMDEEEWDAEEHPWQRIDRLYASLTGFHTFYAFSPTPGSSESEYGEIRLDPPEIPLSDRFPLKYRNYNGNDYKIYVRLVERITNLFVIHNRANVSKERVSREAKEIVEFEKEIYELKPETPSYKTFSYKEFIDKYETNASEENEDPKSKIHWQSVIQQSFDMVNIKVDPSAKVSSRNFIFIERLQDLLKKTPARIIVNYVHWNFISKMLVYTSEIVRDDLFILLKEEYGVKERPPRWMECTIEMKMAHAAAYVFVNKYFTNSTKIAALEMINNVRLAMNKQIEKSNWLDDESKIWAKDKLNSMNVFLGFPEWYKNRTAVVNYYKGMTIGSEYFDNTLSYMRYERKRTLKTLLPFDGKNDPWTVIDPITVNAIYGTYDGNSLNIPAADFQAPLFTPQLPDCVNYGVAGVVIGHEMSHGFDDRRIRNGKSKKAKKLTRDVLKNYYQNANCFSRQFFIYYHGITPPKYEGITRKLSIYQLMMPKHLQTRGENIADTTGVQAVFEAYREKTKSITQMRLPGLEEFTDDQLFFISFAALWCSIGTPEYEVKKSQSMDPHSPSRLRVIGAVSNTKDFANVFNCLEGSPMNPSNKCSIWEKPEIPAFGGGRMRARHETWNDQWNY